MNHLGEKLTALVDGELGHDDRDRALAHLAVCDQCRHEAAELRGLKRRLRSLGDVGLPGGLTDRLLAIGALGAGADDADPAGSGTTRDTTRDELADGSARPLSDPSPGSPPDLFPPPGLFPPGGTGGDGRPFAVGGTRHLRPARRPRRTAARSGYAPAAFVPAALFLGGPLSEGARTEGPFTGETGWDGYGTGSGFGALANMWEPDGTAFDDRRNAGSPWVPPTPPHVAAPGPYAAGAHTALGSAALPGLGGGSTDRRKGPRARHMAMSAATFALFGISAASYALGAAPEPAAPRVAPALQRFPADYALTAGSTAIVRRGPTAESARSAVAPTGRPTP